MEKTLTIVTVVDSIAATSMPINEFVIYRSKKGHKAKQVLLTLDGKRPAEVELADDIEVYRMSDRKYTRKVVKDVLNRCENVVFHLHHQKSGVQFIMATFGLGIRSKSLYTIHSTYSGRDLKYKISSCFCTFWAKRANCVSHAAYAEYNKMVRLLKGKSFTAIPNGVDVERVTAQLTQKSETARKTMICVGRMIPIKNHPFLIELLSKLPDYKLILVGVEDAEGKIRQMVKDYGLEERVTFTGLLKRDDVFRLFNEASLYVSSSTVEGLPVSVLEAMTGGLVPVLSDIAPHKEIAKACRHTFAISLDQSKWLEVMDFLNSTTNLEFDTMCSEVRDDVIDKFSLDSMHAQYNDIYSNLTR